MQHPEGLKVTLLEESLLDSAGILIGQAGTPASYGLSDEAVKLFLLVASAGDDGLPRSRIPKELKADLNYHLLPLEMQSLVTWERDKRGRLAYLVLTWKGQETLAAAKPPKRTHANVAGYRRAQLRG